MKRPALRTLSGPPFARSFPVLLEHETQALTKSVAQLLVSTTALTILVARAEPVPGRDHT